MYSQNRKIGKLNKLKVFGDKRMKRPKQDTIVLSVLLRNMDSDYPFGIFKLFFGSNACIDFNAPDNVLLL
jgi:hypothetical protein